MFSQPHKYDTHGPTNLWQADSFIRSGKICNYGYPLEVSKSHLWSPRIKNLGWFPCFLYKLPPSSSILFVSLRFFGAPKNMENHHQFQFQFHSSLRKDGGTYSTLHCGGCLCSGLGGAEFWIFFSRTYGRFGMEFAEIHHQQKPWHHISWAHGRYKASNGICRSCKRTVSQIWKWMISKERFNIPIHRGFSMTDNANPSAWISTPGGVVFKRFGISHGICDCGGLSPKVRASWHHWVSFCPVIGHLLSWFPAEELCWRLIVPCCKWWPTEPGSHWWKREIFHRVFGWTFKKSTSIDVSRETVYARR